ncbi:MAG: hypothetical protein JOZ51_23045 [Chloroflexi bacterium]|nr:hypothetical protein [Chloroflexota bacterium]
MLNHYQRLTLGIVLMVNLAAVTYSGLVVWLSASWMLNDHIAATMPSWGWIVVALQRAASGVVLALLVGVVLFGVNALLLRLARISSWRIPLMSAGMATAIVSGVAIVGSVLFALTKPFM